jgi:hypothetical protein
MRLIAVILLAPVLLVGWQLWSDRTLERRLQPIASGISGRAVEVDCQSFLGALVDTQGREGEVWFDASGAPERKLFLTRPTCGRLRSFAGRAHHRELDCLAGLDWHAADPLPFDSDCYRRSSDTVYAVLILAHESYHTAGVTDEAAANCYALQAMAWAALQLGARTEEATLLARTMEVLEPKQGSGYETSDCHAGLRLDLNPGTPDFPTERPIVPPLGRVGSA